MQTRLTEMVNEFGLPYAEVDDVVAALPSDVPEDWRNLAACLAIRWPVSRDDPLRIAVGGGQGAGKSTFAQALALAYAHQGLRAAVLSIDDFYLNKAQRAKLAARVHPLFATRGPPGTHDVAEAQRAVQMLTQRRLVEVPRFDKALDERLAEPARLAGPFDVVVFEGWCVGATPEPRPRLDQAVNDLERKLDPDGVWRRHANAELSGSYTTLFGLFDQLVYLAVPSLDAVRRWRLDQERHRPPDKRLDARAVAAFVEHYERLTRWMWEEVPQRASVTVRLGEDHRIVQTSFRP